MEPEVRGLDREALAASAAGTAARLRMQLSHMTAASQLLERMQEGDKARSYLAVMNQSICRMLRIVGRMELLERLTNEDEVRLFSGELDLGSWLRELCPRIRSILGGAGVEFSYQGPELLMASLDRELVQQLLLELIGSVARPGGQVTLTVTGQGESVCLTIRGKAIQPSAQEPEQDPDELEQWGLPLARQIAELHGGSLVVETKTGGELAYVAALPLRPPAPGKVLESPKLPYHSGGFDKVQVAFSELLPPEAFLWEEP